MKYSICLGAILLASGSFAAATPVAKQGSLFARQSASECADRREDWEECKEDLEDEHEDWQECLADARAEEVRFRACVPPTGEAGRLLDEYYACQAEEDRLEDIADACDDVPNQPAGACSAEEAAVKAQEEECSRIKVQFDAFGVEDCFMRERHWREELEECAELEQEYNEERAKCAAMEANLC